MSWYISYVTGILDDKFSQYSVGVVKGGMDFASDWKMSGCQQLENDKWLSYCYLIPSISKLIYNGLPRVTELAGVQFL